MSPKTLKCLKESGWSEQRRIDISKYENVLTNEGYLLSDKIRNFLRSFGGLYIKHPHFRIPEEEDEFHLDPISASKSIYPEKVEEYNERVGAKLTVIGEISNGHMVMMMSFEGEVYAAYDDYMIFLGKTGIDSLVTLCEGLEAKEV